MAKASQTGKAPRGVLTGSGQLLAPPAGDNGAHGHGHKPAIGRAAAGVAVGMAADQRKEIEELWRQNRRQQQQLLELQAEKAALRTQLADQRTQIDELLKEAEYYRSQLSPHLLETHDELYKQRVLQRRNWWQRLMARLSARK